MARHASSSLFLVLQPLLVAILAWGPAFTTAELEPCPGLAVAIPKLKLSPTYGGRRGNVVPVGGHVYALVTLANTRRTTLQDVALQVQLPDYLVPKQTATLPRLKKRSSAKGPLVADVRYLYWTGLTLAPGKIRRFLVKAMVPGCQNTTAVLAVEASAYVTANDGTTVTCLTEADPSTFGVSPALGRDRRINRHHKSSGGSDACTFVPPPPPIPADAGYSFYASSQRCAEAVLTPLRRTSAVEETMNSAYQRALSPTTNPTPNECTSPTCYWICVGPH